MFISKLWNKLFPPKIKMGLSASKNMSEEYYATVVRLGEIKPIESADKIAQTLIDGRTIVIGKEHQEGDVMIYVSNECQICDGFMKANNLYEDPELNSNYEEVAAYLSSHTLTEDERREYLRERRGYFDKHARVRMKRLRGIMSMGFLVDPSALLKWIPELDVNFDELVGKEFDTVNGQLFVKVFVPEVKEHPHRDRSHKRNKKIAKFNRMIPGQFSFHYDTANINKDGELRKLKPTNHVTVSTKLHGTSICIGNVLVRKPLGSKLYKKIFVYLPKFLQRTIEEYDVVYSSRTVIKNANINENVTPGFYGSDIWGEYYEILKNFIPKGYEIFGEIVGYLTGGQSMIQKGYDYGCAPGTNKMMPYRISETLADGTKKEWEVDEVRKWTQTLMEAHPEIADRLLPIDILYMGTLAEYAPQLDVADHWHENLLELMKMDKDWKMEELEPLCKNKVPREGVVIRITDDPNVEAFKLKCVKFLEKESAGLEANAGSDIEMAERYT